MRPIATTRSAAGIPTGRLAVWWVVVSEIVIFGGLLASYVMHRLAHDAWAAEAAHTNTLAGAFNTFVLLTSSLSAVLAHQAAEQGDGRKAAKLLWATIGGGAVFLTVKAFEWTHETSGPSTTRRPACTPCTSWPAWS
jgi:heme/copper-type cytochrome/quinol oxidase subunit 3